MRQAENKVFIEGILSEIDIVERTYTKDGVQNNALALRFSDSVILLYNNY